MSNDFVDRVLLLNDNPLIGKFCLTHEACAADHFVKWISHIMRRKVQELIISIKKSCDCMRIQWNFNCESLRILKLDIKDHISIPSSICFTSIEVLHLENIAFFRDKPTDEINMSCPILEECVIDYCDWLKISTVNISAPRLQNLTICDGRGLDDSQNCEIKIHAENLTFLCFTSDFSYQYSLIQLSSLVHAAGVRNGFALKKRDPVYGTTPPCCLSHLKLVEIPKFTWNVHEMWFVQFLMKSITNTNTLTIELPRCVEIISEWREGKEKAIKELEAVAEGSNCVLIYA